MPCQHGGECADTTIGAGSHTIASYKCSCSAGFTGLNCNFDMNECASAPCANGGTCTEPEGGAYSCECAAGWAGESCKDKAGATVAPVLELNLEMGAETPAEDPAAAAAAAPAAAEEAAAQTEGEAGAAAAAAGKGKGGDVENRAGPASSEGFRETFTVVGEGPELKQRGEQAAERDGQARAEPQQAEPRVEAQVQVEIGQAVEIGQPVVLGEPVVLGVTNPPAPDGGSDAEGTLAAEEGAAAAAVGDAGDESGRPSPAATEAETETAARPQDGDDDAEDARRAAAAKLAAMAEAARKSAQGEGDTARVEPEREAAAPGEVDVDAAQAALGSLLQEQAEATGGPPPPTPHVIADWDPRLDALLAAHRLERLEPGLRALGVEEPLDLEQVTDEELVEMGAKTVVVRRFRQAVAEVVDAAVALSHKVNPQERLTFRTHAPVAAAGDSREL
eukprot:COSAG04_NODE_2042_length_4939_cov_10.170868_1_plen_448_part_00